jgi:hypothetical protein
LAVAVPLLCVLGLLLVVVVVQLDGVVHLL